jgi:phosphatidylinositol alpha-1,6-mannosyltransferase
MIPAAVDVARFRPLDVAERGAARREIGLDPDRPLVLGVSRLVPRKGFDTLLAAVAALPADVQLAIAGAGRDRARLESRAARLGIAGRVRFLGRVPDSLLAPLYGCADVFAMLCRERWGGLEAEGFGIVFAEAAAAGLPVVAGRSGGSAEAVADGKTGFVVDPRDDVAARDALARLLEDAELRTVMGAAARQRAEKELSYDELVARLAPIARGDLSSLAPIGTS